ncbi:MAG: di-heme oxidoredictase family protein [Pseudomonadota bacterium]
MRLKLLLVVFFLSIGVFAWTIYERSVIPAYGDAPEDMAIFDVVDPRSLTAGDLTTHKFGQGSFSEEVANLDWRLSLMFDKGDGHFERPYKVASASSQGSNGDGLGPIYNATSCESCHMIDGRTEPLPGQGLLVRLSVPGTSDVGGPKPHPVYGGQFGDVAIPGVAAEGRVDVRYIEIEGTYGDGTPYTLLQPEITLTELAYGPLGSDTMMSFRAPLSMFGLGLIEAIADETLLELADPEDADGDGISGRTNMVWDHEAERVAIGRFGWKAEQPTIRTQSADAAHNDIGVTSPIFPRQTCTDTQALCAAAIEGRMTVDDRHDEGEFTDEMLEEMRAYLAFLAVPARGHLDHPAVNRGEELFASMGCAACHTTEMQTGNDHKWRRLRNKTIRPYTDFLLHDMGPGLADNRPSYTADGREWRTAPLWGIGLLETVNGHTRLLHDGRARNFPEAILWHGGEAEAAKEAFRLAPAADRGAIITFLKSL